ncbi:hypothetical protein SeMB42_g06982 [Synchytrium endobioticum]|uniref:ABC transmembrane type-1 domain-containing protein n=1 Tax=Synchytrium endobioticum TaxID=286115 RepID=A0A507CC32_9FUNG|nr:hypothetical protein SeMB42_g06982 [Synchytrium endobioticum]
MPDTEGQDLSTMGADDESAPGSNGGAAIDHHTQPRGGAKSINRGADLTDKHRSHGGSGADKEEEVPDVKPPVPIRSWSHHNLLVRWTFMFMDELVRRGLKRDLVADDLPAIDPPDESRHLVAKFMTAWQKEIELRGPEHANIWKAAFYAYGTKFMLGGLTFLLEAVLQIGEALLLGQLLTFFQSPTAPAQQGYLAATGLSLCVITHGVIHHVEFFLTMRAGMQLRVAMIAVIYTKCLRLYQNCATSGLIVNLVSNDVQRFEDAAPLAHFVWIGPFQALMVLYFAWAQISWAALIGLAVIFAFMPVQGFFGRTFGRLRKETVKWRDERIRTMADMISGMQIVKLYAWEPSFEEQVHSMRDQETKFIGKANIMRAINGALYFCTSAIIGMFAWTALWLFGATFTAAKIFTTIYLFGILRVTIFNFFPKAVQFISESMISMRRIRAFLLLPEINPDAQTPDSLAIHLDIAVNNASFSWGQPATAGSQIKEDEKVVRPVTLQSLNLQVAKGTTVAVCGAVGSGKSSLLSALLGEMNLVEGQCALSSRKIGYAPQLPWLITGSIKDNIVFGREWDEERFGQVLYACGMCRDLELLPNGADTVIGERGVTLSGGQRARLSMSKLPGIFSITVFGAS